MERETPQHIPFRHGEVPPRVLSTEGTTADVFEFEAEKNETYVYKELRKNSWLQRAVPGTLEEKAQKLSRLFQVLKKHYGEALVDTHYIIAENKDGKPCIMAVQPKIEGVTIDKLKIRDKETRTRYVEAQDVLLGFEKIWEEQVVKDPELTEISSHSIEEALGGETGLGCNVILTPDGKYKIIDW